MKFSKNEFLIYKGGPVDGGLGEECETVCFSQRRNSVDKFVNVETGVVP